MIVKSLKRRRSYKYVQRSLRRIGNNQSLRSSSVSESCEKQSLLLHKASLFVAAVAAVGVIYQAKEMVRATNAAVDATRTAERAMELGQRAWLSPDSVVFKGGLGAEEVGRFIVKYKNVGREPALQVRYQTAVGFAKDGGELKWEDYCAIASAKNDTGTTAYPSESTTYEINTYLKAGTLEKPIIDGVLVLYLSGCIAYMSFDSERRSAFCFYWLRDTKVPVDQWQWRYCPKGNDAS